MDGGKGIIIIININIINKMRKLNQGTNEETTKKNGKIDNFGL